MIIFSSRLLKRILILEIEACPVIAGLHMALNIAFHSTYLAANFGCVQFRIMPEMVFKLLLSAIWSSCSVLLESEQTPFTRKGCLLISAALQDSIWNIQICPIPYFYSVTNAWSKDWVKQWALLWLVIKSRELQQKFHFTWEKIYQLSQPKIYKALVASRGTQN